MKKLLINLDSAIGSYFGTGAVFSADKNRCFSVDSRFYVSKGLWMTALPVLIVFLSIIIENSGLDIWWESLFFDASTLSWPLRDHWLFEKVIHEGGRLFNIFIAGRWLLIFITTFLHKPLKKYQKPMLYFIVAAATGPVIVGILKQTTHIYTPWDIIPFSGEYPYIHLFDTVPEGLPAGEAFPSGHASGGYAFFSLYFLLHQLKSPHKKYGIAAGLILGGIYGFGQQVRGAHFPSHDLYSLVICWYAAFLIYFLFYPKQWRELFNDQSDF